MFCKLLVPKPELLDQAGPRSALSGIAPQQAVALLEHAQIPGEVANIAPVDLAHQAIHEAAPATWRPPDKIKVLRREEHRLDHADGVLHASRLVIDANDLAQRPCALGCPLHPKLEVDRFAVLDRASDHPSKRSRLQILTARPVDHIAIM